MTTERRMVAKRNTDQRMDLLLELLDQMRLEELAEFFGMVTQDLRDKVSRAALLPKDC